MSEKKKRCRSTFYYDGKQYECAGKSQKEADQKAAVKLDKLKRGEIGLSGNMTVSRWANTWLETYKKTAVTNKTYDDYKSMIDKIIIPAIGSLRLTDVTDVHLQQILNKKANYSYSRIHKLQTRICSMFQQAKASRLINHNPAEFLVTPKAEAGTHRSITLFEREHFLKACEAHHAGLMFKVMLYCGLRTGEVVALEWRDIDTEKKRIKISRAIESGTNTVKAPKTKAGIREVPIPDEIYNELISNKGKPFEPIFKQSRGKVRHTHSSRVRAWKSLKEDIDKSMGAVYEEKKGENGVKYQVKKVSVVADDFVPYCLRHTYCTDLQDKGVPINIAKYLMGHSDISVTASIYTHISETAIEDAANLINNGKNNGSDKMKNTAKRRAAREAS